MNGDFDDITFSALLFMGAKGYVIKKRVPVDNSTNMSDSEQSTVVAIDPPPPPHLKVPTSVYPSWAHITRSFKIPIKVGQNQVRISGLPDVLEDNSLRVEGNGAAIIQDVTISEAIYFNGLNSNSKLKTLKLEKNAIKALSTHLSTVNARNVRLDGLQDSIRRYDEVIAELDGRLVQLRKERDQLAHDIASEQSSTDPKHLLMSATVGIFGEFEGEVDLTLYYVVTHAGWTPIYDLQVNTATKEKCVKLVYEASITQTTGEAWNDVPLTLGTTSPLFDCNNPSLSPWTLSLNPFKSSQATVVACESRSSSAKSPTFIGRPSMRRRTVAAGHNDLEHANATTTFEVLGYKTVPSDGSVHKVTVTVLELDGELKWVSIPTKDSRMHWMAMMRNDSEYPLIKGKASIHINGDLTSFSEIPYVSPQERFNCTLGVDQSIRIVYHPHEKECSQTGFFFKSNKYIFTQRISLMNTKLCDVANVKVLEHIPVSEGSSIAVKPLSPALPMVEPGSTKKKVDVSKSIQVCKGVVAQWEKGDDGDIELGSDGKFSWICSIPAQGKVDLVLCWKVAVPAGKRVAGLIVS
ncbi:hypothetical protein BDQ17DRAFT_1423911 [Cyathus striatus]|nr:hypothetical protein BDQ17DRAFT_1423911 [Cyathus striatus]